MSAPASYLAARVGCALYVRSIGLANMKSAPVLDALLQSAAPEATTICVDLSACTGMDSTFMGLLVGHGKALEQAHQRLVIINPSPQNLRLLRMLGVDVVVPIVEGHALPEAEFVTIESRPDQSPAARLELVQRAHQHLARLSDANQAKFGPVLAALEADLRRTGAP